MRKQLCISGVFVMSMINVLAQKNAPANVDSVLLLSEVVVTGFANDRPLSEVPASIGYLNTKTLERFSNTSFLSAINQVSGIRMEERSPGSYRFSIRGSLLRSPFGIRNVKMYWNGLPLTDGGGNTYFNLVDFSSIGSIEIIKGPGSSLYGSGTGGVVLLSNPDHKENALQFSSVFGSFGLQRYELRSQLGSDKIKANVQFAHQQAEGYRQHTEMERNAISTDIRFISGKKSTLSWLSFYSDLFYDTPGGLTLSQFEIDPTQARPGNSFAPGSVQNKASVHNKTVYTGLSYESQWTDKWTTTAGVFASHTNFANPSIRNYESREETNVGGRVQAQYAFEKREVKGKLTTGFELQYFNSPIGVFDNDAGEKTNIVQSDDELTSAQTLGFIQLELDLPFAYFLTLGSSVSYLNYTFLRKFPAPEINQERNFKTEFSPRVALLKKLSAAISVFGSVSNGFSPPSLAEVRPSTNTFSTELQAERGINYELGVKTQLLNHRLRFDFTLYDFKLSDAIVIQRATDGAEFFVNAGKTDQKGIEAQLTWQPQLPRSGVMTDFVVNSSYTYNHYRFVNYVQDGLDHSGNRLTGVPPVVFTLGVDVELRRALYFNLTGNFTDHIPLNDANDIYAASYFLFGMRAGYKAFQTKKFPIEFFAGADNLLDERYSLGNDLNAFGGRYFNAAPTRNYFVGLKATLAFRKAQ